MRRFLKFQIDKEHQDPAHYFQRCVKKEDRPTTEQLKEALTSATNIRKIRVTFASTGKIHQ